MVQGLLGGQPGGLCPTPGPALPLPRVSHAQGQVLGEAQCLFQHCSTAKGGPKAFEKHPLGVIF